MFDKQVVLFIYGLIGICLTIVLPIWKRNFLFNDQNNELSTNMGEPSWLIFSLYFFSVIIFIGLFKALPLTYLTFGALVSVLIGAMALKHRLVIAISMYLGLLVITVLPWWLRPSDWNLSIDSFQSVVAISVTVFSYWHFTKGSTAQVTGGRSLLYTKIFIYIVFAFGVAYFALYVGLVLAVADWQTWHHWSAYIGPAKLMAAGALPLRDIPIQYGLGSALILSQGCKLDCWITMYWLSSITTILLTYILAYIALQFNYHKNLLSIAATLAVVTVSCLFWTSYPPAVGGPLTTPSTSGLRFLPGLLVLAWVLIISKQHYMHEKYAHFGHLLWLACILWSPEAGIHATLVWVPFFVWTRTFKENKHSPKVNFLHSILILIAVLLAGIIIFVFVYWSYYRELPLLGEYLRYILLPPGAMEINPKGTLWFAILCVVCWLLGITTIKSINIGSREFQKSWAISLLCFANFSYYLGRSHDNNILNLIPYFTLLLLATRATTSSIVLKTISTTLLSAILGFTTLFGWGIWKEIDLQGQSINASFKRLTDSYNRENDNNFFYRLPAIESRMHPSDAGQALKYIHENFQESVVVLDPYLLLNSGEQYDYWTALQVPTNFLLLPANLRRTYLERISKRLNKSGWVIYKPGYEDYIKDFDSVYNRDEMLVIGSYKAIRYIPK